MDSHSETAQKRRQREFENFESMLHVSPWSPLSWCVCVCVCVCVCSVSVCVC